MGALGGASFTYGLVMAVASEIPSCDPTRQQPEKNGYIYANDGHTILAILRGSQARELVRRPRALVRAEDPRGDARLAARATLVEGPDPDRLPEHDLLRERRLRDP